MALVSTAEAESGAALTGDTDGDIIRKHRFLALCVRAPARLFVGEDIGLGNQVLVELEGFLIHQRADQGLVSDGILALGGHAGDGVLSLLDFEVDLIAIQE